MAIMDSKQGKGMAIVDPESGHMIQHVKAIDIERGMLEVWSMTAAYPGMEMLIVENGVTVALPYTVVQTTNMNTGRKEYMSAWHRCSFDVINKNTGEVLHEVPGPRAPLRVREPWTVAEENRQALGG